MIAWDWPSFLIGCVVGATAVAGIMAALFISLADTTGRR